MSLVQRRPPSIRKSADYRSALNDPEVYPELFDAFCAAEEYMLGAGEWVQATRQLAEKAACDGAISHTKLVRLESLIQRVQNRVSVVKKDLIWLEKQYPEVFSMFVGRKKRLHDGNAKK